MARICIYMHLKQWYEITHQYPNFNGGLVKPSLKLGYGWEIKFYIKTMDVITYHS